MSKPAQQSLAMLFSAYFLISFKVCFTTLFLHLLIIWLSHMCSFLWVSRISQIPRHRVSFKLLKDVQILLKVLRLYSVHLKTTSPSECQSLGSYYVIQETNRKQILVQCPFHYGRASYPSTGVLNRRDAQGHPIALILSLWILGSGHPLFLFQMDFIQLTRQRASTLSSITNNQLPNLR